MKDILVAVLIIVLLMPYFNLVRMKDINDRLGEMVEELKKLNRGRNGDSD